LEPLKTPTLQKPEGNNMGKSDRSSGFHLWRFLGGAVLTFKFSIYSPSYEGFGMLFMQPWG